MKSCPRFAYSFVYLTLTNTVGPAIHTPPIGEAQCMKKVHSSLLLALRIRPTSAIGTTNIPLFAYKDRMPHRSNNISCGSYIATLYWRYVARTASPILPGLAYNLGSTY